MGIAGAVIFAAFVVVGVVVGRGWTLPIIGGAVGILALLWLLERLGKHADKKDPTVAYWECRTCQHHNPEAAGRCDQCNAKRGVARLRVPAGTRRETGE